MTLSTLVPSVLSWHSYGGFPLSPTIAVMFSACLAPVCVCVCMYVCVCVCVCVCVYVYVYVYVCVCVCDRWIVHCRVGVQLNYTV